ncbi:MAG: hypothetical protein H0V44_13445 [Planctomycetes bacterium]|nr:hypothetical protein [Planctomycetota bacterium]
MNWIKIFFIVTGGALAGMLMGGIFGLAAGTIAPGLFAHLVPWSDVEPRGAATVYGATGGVICGGSLAAFALILQFLWDRNKH